MGEVIVFPRPTPKPAVVRTILCHPLARARE